MHHLNPRQLETLGFAVTPFCRWGHLAGTEITQLPKTFAPDGRIFLAPAPYPVGVKDAILPSFPLRTEGGSGGWLRFTGHVRSCSCWGRREFSTSVLLVWEEGAVAPELWVEGWRINIYLLLLPSGAEATRDAQLP